MKDLESSFFYPKWHVFQLDISDVRPIFIKVLIMWRLKYTCRFGICYKSLFIFEWIWILLQVLVIFWKDLESDTNFCIFLKGFGICCKFLYFFESFWNWLQVFVIFEGFRIKLFLSKMARFSAGHFCPAPFITRVLCQVCVRRKMLLLSF